MVLKVHTKGIFDYLVLQKCVLDPFEAVIRELLMRIMLFAFVFTFNIREVQYNKEKMKIKVMMLLFNISLGDQQNYSRKLRELSNVRK